MTSSKALFNSSPEFSLRRPAESFPHSVLEYSLSTATAAPKLPTLLLAPASSTTLMRPQYSAWIVQRVACNAQQHIEVTTEARYMQAADEQQRQHRVRASASVKAA